MRDADGDFEPAVTPEPRRRDRVCLAHRRSHVRWLDAEDVHACGESCIHTVTPVDDEMAATLVLQGPERDRRALVFRRPDAARDPGRALINPETIRRLLDEVLDALTTNVPRPRGPSW